MKHALWTSILLIGLGIASCALDDAAGPQPGAGSLTAPVQTADSAKSSSGPGIAAVCGDGVCTPDIEGCGNCPGDCPCWQQGTICSGGQCVPICGDGVCLPDVEGCGNCPVDCPCPSGLVCSSGQCVDPDPCGGDPCCGDICCRKPWLCEPQP
jgi:hypothetical protein